MNYISDMDFTKRIRGLITMVGSAERLAKLSGMSARVIGRYLEGASDPTRNKLIALANATGVTVEWLATGTDPMRQDELMELIANRGMKLDANMMKDVITEIEVIFFKHGLSLTPAKKADLILLIYEELLDGVTKKENVEDKIVKLAKLAG